MQKPYGCFFPLNALAIHPQGTQKFCLTSNLPGCENTTDFEKVRHEIHMSLLKGEWPESCRSCRRQEEQGLQSRRLKMWERKAEIYDRSQAEVLIQQAGSTVLRHLEISFSNVCNLNCAMCSSEFSTSWISADEQAVREGLDFRDFTKKYQKLKRLSEKTVDEILDSCQNVDLLIVKGGEPTREPLFFKFIKGLLKNREGRLPGIFLQTNGTRPPKEWLPELGNAKLEVGFSIDGWGDNYEWIRGTSFARVLENLRYLEEQPQVTSLSIDFTLSVFNCLHLPEFLERVLELKEKLTKLKTCPFFQWAQEPYSRPDNILLSERMRVINKIQPLLAAHPEFFLNCENILKVLGLTVSREDSRKMAVRWISYMNTLRGRSLYDLQPGLRAALENQLVKF